MRQREWKKLKAKMATLTFAQRQALKEELVSEDDAAASVEVVEAQGSPSNCPQCAGNEVIRNGQPILT